MEKKQTTMQSCKLLLGAAESGMHSRRERGSVEMGKTVMDRYESVKPLLQADYR